MLKGILTITLSLFLQACIEEEPLREVDTTTDSSSEVADSDSNSFDAGDISTLNFLQEGSSRSTSTLTLFRDFDDSFLLRGDEVHLAFKNFSLNNRFCLAAYFPETSGTGAKKLLLLAARVRTYANPRFSGNEYYVQMEVENDEANADDCLAPSQQSQYITDFSTASFALSLSDLCPNCSGTVVSKKLKLYTQSGLPMAAPSLQNLSLTLVPPLGTLSNTGVLTCSGDSFCQSNNYNCCVQGQCVNHGTVKTGVDTTSDEYKIAIAQIIQSPDLIFASRYQDIFHVCTEFEATDPTNSNDDPSRDLAQEATDRFDELQDLYNCLNPQYDEYALCTVEIDIDESAIGSGGTTLTNNVDDITFSDLNGSLTFNNIVNVEYAGTRIYQESFDGTETVIAQPAELTINSAANDDITSAQSITVDKEIPADATNSKIKARFRIDGTCEQLSTSLARCTKSYTQGQVSTPARSTDHTSGDNDFLLPSYANLGLNVVVEVGGTKISPGTSTWSANTAPSNRVSFAYTIFDNQTVDITYFVTTNVTNLTLSREAALATVVDICNCDSSIGCNLKEDIKEINGVETLVGYLCDYEQESSTETLLQETVYVSSRTAPHRYFDVDGVHYELDDIDQGQEQEGTKHEYVSNNLYRPTNLTSTVGFNEIYGSFNRDGKSAVPATVVDLVRGREYDVFTDTGQFSTCLSCGTDYFSSLQKLFPSNFSDKGGGLRPSLVENRRFENQSTLPSTDLKFGRACFVPATMIPWTHVTNTDTQIQRLERLEAQHFLFANGYNRDWYGFDYGSLIGSYDGVKWFSIGNQRRIKAETNKLYLAVNSYFNDLTLNNAYQVTISERVNIADSGSEVDHDTESDGAECQKAHYCETDNDCISTLGYDYVCENVGSFNTSWPTFDDNANEQSGSINISLLSLIDGSNGEINRCVYRGKGAICEETLSSVSASTSYTLSSKLSLHACSPNNYCETLDQSSFNNKIARFGQSPVNQNRQSVVTNVLGLGDTFGEGARLIGRPLNLLGTDTVDADLQTRFSLMNVNSICIPGKAPDSATSIAGLNSTTDGARLNDKVSGIGVTSTSTTFTPGYLAACPASDDEGDWTHYQSANLTESLTGPLSTEDHRVYATSQNLPTNALDLSVFTSSGLFNDDDTVMTKLGIQKNACLRAPGAPCYSDFDCGPNKFIADKFKVLGDISTVLNDYERAFWEEELVCATPLNRYLPISIVENPFYDISVGKCCRELGNDFTYQTEAISGAVINVHDGADHQIPGVTKSLQDVDRYSSTQVIYDKLVNESSTHPPVKMKASLSLTEILQYNSIHEHNSRMCCTGHWVRNFATENGGGHQFSGTKQQSTEVDNLKYLNWNPDTGTINTFPTAYDETDLHFTCDTFDYLTSDCEIKNLVEGSTYENRFLEYLAKFELTGIPQVLIEDDDESSGAASANRHNTLTNFDTTNDNQEIFAGSGTYPTNHIALPGTIVEGNAGDVTYDSKTWIRGDNMTEIDSSNKQVFSSNSFNCCLPTGVPFDANLGYDRENCCSGTLKSNDDGVNNVCCLDDFTDVSVYTNRYVSSEGAYTPSGREVTDAEIDPETGYLKKELVIEMAKNMCCSGTAAEGVAVGTYFIPINHSNKITSPTPAMTRRFIQNQTLDNDVDVGGAYSKFEAGLKWNNHVYCVPASFADGAGGGGAVVTD